MKKNLRDNMAKFFYDTGKLNFGVLVLGAVPRRPFPYMEFVCGVILTLIFFLIGIMIDLFKAKEE